MVHVHNSTSKGGAPAHNENAAKRLAWVESFDLSTPAGLDEFLKAVIRATWEGKLGSRSAAAINSQIRILSDRLDMQRLEKRISELENERFRR